LREEAQDGGARDPGSQVARAPVIEVAPGDHAHDTARFTRDLDRRVARRGIDDEDLVRCGGLLAQTGEQRRQGRRRFQRRDDDGDPDGQVGHTPGPPRPARRRARTTSSKTSAISRTTRTSEYRSTTRRRPASARRRAKAGFSSTTRIASASAPTDRGGTSNPDSKCVTISSGPPSALAITGTPA